MRTCRTHKSFVDLLNLWGNQEHLDNLYLLTVADIRGTSATTWTAWKGHLLNQLYQATSALLAEKTIVEADISQQVRDIQSQTLDLLESPISEQTLKQYWEMLDDEYFLTLYP